MVSKRLAIAAMLAMMSSYGYSDNLYRYKNDVGGTAVDRHMPAKFAAAFMKCLTQMAQRLR